MAAMRSALTCIRLHLLFFLFLFSALLLTACSRAPRAETRLCPQEDCREFLAGAIGSAERSIDCAFYELSDGDVISALEEAAARNVSVRLVLDRNNEKRGFPSAELPFSRIASSSGLMHHKFCVLDAERVLTGGTNPTPAGLSENRNDIVLIHDRAIARLYAAEFEELWNGEFPGRRSAINGIGPVRAFFCPEDRCRQALVGEIRAARRDIRVLAFSFTDDALGTELILAHHRGIGASVLFDVRQNKEYSQMGRIAIQGIPTRTFSGPGLLHYKVWIIDSETVVTGSFNPSANAISRNEENVLIVRDAGLARRYLDEFWLLWEEAGGMDG